MVPREWFLKVGLGKCLKTSHEQGIPSCPTSPNSDPIKCPRVVDGYTKNSSLNDSNGMGLNESHRTAKEMGRSPITFESKE